MDAIDQVTVGLTEARIGSDRHGALQQNLDGAVEVVAGRFLLGPAERFHSPVVLLPRRIDALGDLLVLWNVLGLGSGGGGRCEVGRSWWRDPDRSTSHRQKSRDRQ